MPIGPIVTDDAQGNTADSGTSGAGTVVGGPGATEVEVEVEVEVDGTVVDAVDDGVEDVDDAGSATEVEVSSPEAERSAEDDEHETNSTPATASAATNRIQGGSARDSVTGGS